MKRILVLLFAVFMSMGLACGSVFIIDSTIIKSSSQDIAMQEEDEEVSMNISGYWKNEGKGAVDGGSGTKSDPYVIRSRSGLINFMWMVNDTSQNWVNPEDVSIRDSYWSLECDIDLSSKYWTPIGSFGKAFTGEFDGNGHTISGVHILSQTKANLNDLFGTLKYSDSEAGYDIGSSGAYAIGFFGYTNGAEIHDLNIDGGSIKVSTDGNTTGCWGHIGGLIGLGVNTTVYNIIIDSMDITYTQNYGNDKSIFTDMTVGGIAAAFCGSSDMANCQNINGSININWRNSSARLYECEIGGIVGWSSADSYRNCYNSSSINPSSGGNYRISSGLSLGGIIGFSRVSTKRVYIATCVNSGEITISVALGSLWNGIGGILGGVLNGGGLFNSGLFATPREVAIASCMNYGNITVSDIINSYVGGICGGSNGNAYFTIYSCANFGDLDLTLNSGASSGNGYAGILGHTSDNNNCIYQSVNYGNVNVSCTKECREIGGIVGKLEDNSLITGCINHGNINGGSQGINVGGICGYANNAWFADNAYISNCINLGPVKGKNHYGSILGKTEDDGKVNNCYSRSDIHVKAGEGEEGNTNYTYSELTSFEFLQNSSKWTTNRYANFMSRDYYSIGSGTYPNDYFYTVWFSTPLVFNYYSTVERNSKNMKTTNLLVPFYAVNTYTVSLSWNKRGGEFTQGGSDVGTISFEYNIANGFIRTAEYSYYTIVPFLNGADYSVPSRYEKLFEVEYDDFYFGYKEIYSLYDNKEIMDYSYHTEDYIYAGFSSVFVGNKSFKQEVRVSSIARPIAITSYYAKSFDDVTFENGAVAGTSEVIYQPNEDGGKSYTAYYLDEVNITATPKLGYAVKKLELIRDNSVVQVVNNFSQSIQNSYANSIGQAGQFIPDTDSKTSEIDGFDYKFFNFRLYYVPIVYNYNIVYNWDAQGTSNVISMQDGSNGARGIRTTLSFVNAENPNLIVGSYATLNYGYNYKFYLSNTDEYSEENLIGEDTTGYIEKITFDEDKLLEYLEKLPNSLGLTSFTIYVEREAKEYNVVLNSMINSYKNTSQYDLLNSDSFQTLLFGDMSADTYYSYYGVVMPSYSADIFENYGNSLTSKIYTVEDKFNSSSACSNYGYNYRKVGETNLYSFEQYRTIGSNPQIVTTKNGQQSQNFLYILTQYIKHFKNNTSMLNSSTINIYVYYSVQGYQFTGEAKILDGSKETSSGDLDVSLITRENSNTNLNYYDKNIISYYAPVTLTVNENPYGYSFAGWYVNRNGEKLLSLDENYTFINNPLIADLNSFTITAKFERFEISSTTHTASQDKKIYYVSSADDLVWLSEQVASGNNFDGITIKQTANIDMSGVVFNPIGSVESPFKGIYDGQNYLIENLNLGNYNLNYRGLFGYTEGAYIKNVVLKNLTQNIVGYSYVGSLIGSAKDTTIENINNLCNIQLNGVTYYSIYGNSTGVYLNSTGYTLSSFEYQKYIGGIVGKAENCDLIACSNQGNIGVSSNNENVAGLVGSADSSTTINQSFSSGTFSLNESKNISGLANGTTNINDCYYKNSSNIIVVNGTQSDVAEKFNGIYNANSVNLDGSIWIEVNGGLTLKVFYWA